MTATALPFLFGPTGANATPTVPETAFVSVAHVGRNLIVADRSVPLPSAVVVSGERFKVEQEDGFVYLVHPRWSLVGAGDTYVDAVRDLMAEGRALAEVMALDDPTLLTPEARSMWEYVRAFS